MGAFPIPPTDLELKCVGAIKLCDERTLEFIRELLKKERSFTASSEGELTVPLLVAEYLLFQLDCKALVLQDYENEIEATRSSKKGPI